jgi:penicillin amidase
MRIFYFLLSAVVTVALIIVLNMQLSVGGAKTPRLGYFLSPQKGFWQNAEPANISFNADLKFDSLQGKTEVYFDDRLVPHVYAEKETDAYFVQGYLHAKFRLWQMEFQTAAAGGRLSEIMGDSSNGTNFLKVDKFFRRLGMVYAAEQSLKATEADPVTKEACDNYTAGVNAYINSLEEKDYPLEYKLLDYKPEPWTNLKSMLFLKYMALDLAGFEEDFEMTNAKSYFTKEQFDKLFPYGQDSLKPIVPKKNLSIVDGLGLPQPANVDSAYLNYKTFIAPRDTVIKPAKDNGSNNWAVSGGKTKSGRPILCNDPHLGLNFPSLWYEIQLSTPNFNAYGASFPGAPGVIIGFNDSCAFGFTNAMRDVRDYYEIKFRDSTMKEYWFNNQWQPTTFRDEVIKIRGKNDDTEHIAMTVWGPVMYDKNYPNKLQNDKAYACRWKAHDGSNELLTFLKLDHSKNFNDYASAISTFQCPGQNMIFATKTGDIAIKQQGQFPAKWYRQGDFVMPGDDSSYVWQQNIEDTDNVMMHNPERNFVSSANQYPYDPAIYPYYLGGRYPLYRGLIINRYLASMQNITTDDMQQMQTNNYNVFAEMARPILLKYVDKTNLTSNENDYLDLLASWNLHDDANEKAPIVFKLWWDSLMKETFSDELSQSALPMPKVEQSTLLEALLKDSSYEFIDNINTPQKETIKDVVSAAFKKIIPVLDDVKNNHKFTWGSFKGGGIQHLLRIPALSRLDLNAGGDENAINAYHDFHGPSWRMIVELTDETNAYGIYPGGQTGNPGSKYYDQFVNDWSAGKYYKIAIIKKEDAASKASMGKITFSKS